MNIKELNEGVEKLTKALVEMEHMSDDDFDKAYDQVEKENLEHERKSTFKVYNKAIEALEQLQDIISDSRDPFTDKLDPDTDAFYDKLVDITNEIYSRSLAFEESLDESEIKKDLFGQGLECKSEKLGFGLSIKSSGENLYISPVTYGTQIKELSEKDLTKDQQERAITDISKSIKKCLDELEKDVDKVVKSVDQE